MKYEEMHMETGR